jgi:hypothetical protein
MEILIDKITITASSKKRAIFSENHLHFYMKYAFLVFRTLRKPLFQKFLSWMLRKEEIKEDKIKDIQIKIFPLRKQNGKGLAGKCKIKGTIFIYPRRLEFCREKTQELGKEDVNFYIKSRARAALIHELLHLKYASGEEKVRELTKRYFNIFTKHQHTQNSNAHKIAKMLFT